MDYEQLSLGAKYYNEHYKHWVTDYQRLRERGNEYWLHLERLNENQIRDRIIGFLNDWLCRVAYQSTGSLRQILNSIPPFYATLKDESIERIEFNESKIVEKQRLSNSDIIKEIMNRFLKVRPKFGPVAASKLMHMALPRLLVMWDTGIKSKYGIPTYHAADHARHYLRFVKLMQLQIGHAVDSYVASRDVKTQTAIQRIRKEDGFSTLPRIVDKYNFAIRDRKLRICAVCYNKWLQLIS